MLKRVLNAGSGPPSPRQLHPVFSKGSWTEIRLDIDPQVKPHLVGSVTDMSDLVPPASLDAVWSSHSLEHLRAHEVPQALAEFWRVLKPDGFALITSPDLETVASLILERGLHEPVYISPMGPITPHDMLFGHSDSIERGKVFMAHNTGFTSSSLGLLLVSAGFETILVKRERLDLWALALMPETDKKAIQGELAGTGLDMFDHPIDASRAS
jgi:SAM-dependent methyltransferase